MGLPERKKESIPKSLPYRNYPDVEIMLHPLFLPSAGDMKGITKEMGGLPGVWLEGTCLMGPGMVSPFLWDTGLLLTNICTSC